jgi:ribosomal protein S18 acetylase RimI-like enzyme
MDIRPAQNSDVERLARIWFDGWQDAHAEILPEKLRRVRTLESFEQRMRDGLANTRVAVVDRAPVGLCMMKGDELNQLYVAAEARGAGAAQALIADAEERLAAKGAPLIWLACAIGNDRAARFYEKSGWRNAGVRTIQLDMPDGALLALDIWRFEKKLRPSR